MTVACALSEETLQGIQLTLSKAGRAELFPDWSEATTLQWWFLFFFFFCKQMELIECVCGLMEASNPAAVLRVQPASLSPHRR